MDKYTQDRKRKNYIPSTTSTSISAATAAVTESKNEEETKTEEIKTATNNAASLEATKSLQEIDIEHLEVVACVLQALCETNDAAVTLNQHKQKQKLTKFHAVSKPNISIWEYLLRIRNYGECSDSVFVIALILVDRLVRKYPSRLSVNSFTVHRLLISATLLSAKMYDDLFYDNLFYSSIGGISAKELNSLEVEFLFALDFNILVSAECFSLYLAEIKNHLQLHRAGRKFPALCGAHILCSAEISTTPVASADAPIH